MKIAVIATVWFPLSHADVVVSRWVEPFLSDARFGWKKPDSTIASVYLEQTPANDIGRDFCAVHGIPVYDSIRGALTGQGGKLAVDAVLLIGEHGDYPMNEFQQKLYPRKRLFDGIVEVFRESGRSVPVFNDKHFSWDFAESCAMFATARELNFPLYGGSSLPHCTIDPSPAGQVVKPREALALFHGGPESYGFHSMEFLQAILEERAGCETGIESVRAWENDAVAAAVDAGDISRDLLHRALVVHDYADDESTVPYVLSRVEGPVVFQFLHRDGLKVTHLCMPKFVSRWLAVLRREDGTLREFALQEGRGPQEFFSNFARLNVQVENFFRTGIPPTPVLRTHLITGALQSSLQALRAGGAWQKTPHLLISYTK